MFAAITRAFSSNTQGGQVGVVVQLAAGHGVVGGHREHAHPVALVRRDALVRRPRSSGQIAGTAFHHVSDYTTSDPLANSTWKARLNETWKVLPNAEHALGLFQVQTPAFDFLGARFAGLPAIRKC